MSPVDIQLIYRKIKSIEADLALLTKYNNISLEKYAKNQELQLIVERLLEKITGRLIDLNYHLLKEKYGVMPEDYYDSFAEIGKRKIITAKFAEEIAKSAGLRNALAHEYDKIDEKMVHKAIKTSLTQIPKYLKTILNTLRIDH